MVVPCIRPALFHIHTKQNGSRKPHHEHEEKARLLDVACGIRDESDKKRTQKRARLQKKEISTPVRLHNISASYFVRGGKQCIPPDFFAFRHKLCIARPRIALECPMCKTCLKTIYITPQLPARTKVYCESNISPGVVSPPNGRLCLTNGINPRHPYAGMYNTRRASKVTIRRFYQPDLR